MKSISQPSPGTPHPFLERLKIFATFIAALWIIEIADRLLFQNALQTHGIHPRSFSHLHGILFAPLLHGDLGHLFGNSISLLVLGTMILAWGWRDLALVTAGSALVAGVLVWLIGKTHSNHIGASSLVFGYLSFLLASGYYQRTPRTIIIAILVGLFYGTTLFGIFPGRSGISWESHLGGAIAGVLIARYKKPALSVSTF